MPLSGSTASAMIPSAPDISLTSTPQLYPSLDKNITQSACVVQLSARSHAYHVRLTAHAFAIDNEAVGNHTKKLCRAWEPPVSHVDPSGRSDRSELYYGCLDWTPLGHSAVTSPRPSSIFDVGLPTTRTKSSCSGVLRPCPTQSVRHTHLISFGTGPHPPVYNVL